jgi:hypothetical protein
MENNIKEVTALLYAQNMRITPAYVSRCVKLGEIYKLPAVMELRKVGKRTMLVCDFNELYRHSNAINTGKKTYRQILADISQNEREKNHTDYYDDRKLLVEELRILWRKFDKFRPQITAMISWLKNDNIGNEMELMIFEIRKVLQTYSLGRKGGKKATDTGTGKE